MPATEEERAARQSAASLLNGLGTIGRGMNRWASGVAPDSEQRAAGGDRSNANLGASTFVVEAMPVILQRPSQVESLAESERRAGAIGEVLEWVSIKCELEEYCSRAHSMSIDLSLLPLGGLVARTFPVVNSFSVRDLGALIEVLVVVEVHRSSEKWLAVRLPGAGVNGEGRTIKGALKDLEAEFMERLCLGTFCDVEFLNSADVTETEELEAEALEVLSVKIALGWGEVGSTESLS